MANRIRELRAEKNIGQAQLAVVIGMTANTISQYETGKREPKLKTWKKLAEYFGVSVGCLQGVEEKSVTDVERQERWHERKQSFLKALRESYMLNGSWEDLAQTFKHEWNAHELEERSVQNNGDDDKKRT